MVTRTFEVWSRSDADRLERVAQSQGLKVRTVKREVPGANLYKVTITFPGRSDAELIAARHTFQQEDLRRAAEGGE